jgi:demethylmenaquinone methyltransferase/2-methoxy-6-polyprenyl-1,4-benzoquinol methylase
MKSKVHNTGKVNLSGTGHIPERGEHSTYHQSGVLPVLQTKSEVKAFYNRIAGIYDLLAERSEKSVRRMGLEMLHAQAGEKVLEIGFGTGHCLIELARAVGPSGRVFGMDLSEKMVEIAWKRICDIGLQERIELICGDALHLPYTSASQDGIFMSFTLELFDTPEIPRVLAECKRVLKPGGMIVVVGMSRVVPEGLVTEVFEWAHRHFPSFLDCRPIYVRRALEDAGFTIAGYQIVKVWVNEEIVCGVKDIEGGHEADRTQYLTRSNYKYINH